MKPHLLEHVSEVFFLRLLVNVGDDDDPTLKGISNQESGTHIAYARKLVNPTSTEFSGSHCLFAALFSRSSSPLLSGIAVDSDCLRLWVFVQCYACGATATIGTPTGSF